MAFSELGLIDPIVKATVELGYQTPTPIQEKVIPVILQAQDVLAAAQTGTGKTASFALPVLQRLSGEKTTKGKRFRALVLAPTRELVTQISQDFIRYGKHLDLTTVVLVGGKKIEPQKQRLLEGADIVVATPGRLLDLAYQKALRFDDLQVLVVDEADKMLDMGFIEDLNKIIQRLPQERQNLLFSATLSDRVRQLAKTAMNKPVEISLGKKRVAAPVIEQWLVTVDKSGKSALLAHLIKEHQWSQALIFIRTQHGAEKLVSQLGKRGIVAECLHGDIAQGERTRILSMFKSGKIDFLVATDIAARGIDVEQLPCVINYDLPREPNNYIHRIGRTGRAGAAGEAVSLVSFDDFKNLCAIESRLGHLIERRDLEAFAAKKVVPISILNYVPKSAQKQKPKAAVKRQAVPDKKAKSKKAPEAKGKVDPWHRHK
jgi:superfamily II DNA/RNA helicase